ncbi:heavy metal-binding domain-containing protein [Actinocrispum sp. NPDC049592]|uniref:heavy metal-binding domain-containing protein n=1 Tax=Actinocrispum sp. NPDC049592 TaxID=3154835 RepID=UPI0034208064
MAAFTSAVSVDEYHAITSVGFTPVGQVMGSCVYHTAYARSWDCGFRGWFVNIAHLDGVDVGDESGYGLPTLHGATINEATVNEVRLLREALEESRTLAIDRMREECVALGGDGVVAVTLTATPFPAGGTQLRAIGTAVRAAGPVRADRPFLSDLTGQDFAKLMIAGWVPCGLVLGVGMMVRHDDYRTEMQRLSWSNTEFSGRTKLVATARMAARRTLRADCARYGADGVVIRDSTLRMWEQPCSSAGEGRTDMLAEAILTGTAISRFATGTAPAPLRIMRLH